MAELDQPRVFVLITYFAPARMVAILLAPAGVATGGLQVTQRVGANPHFGVGGRHCQSVNALDLRVVLDALTLSVEVRELPRSTLRVRPG